MAKGRALASSRSERLLGTGNFNFYDHDYHRSYYQNGTVPEVSEFAEDDVWSMVGDTSEDQHHHHEHGRDLEPRAAVDSGRMRRSESAVTCHQQVRPPAGLSLAFEDKAPPSNCRILHQHRGATRSGGPRLLGANRHLASSAPVNVPDWSKILRVNSIESSADSDEDDRVDDSAMEPPHEYLARSRKMNAFSVFEGVGRTLKGRDMTRVRDAIWSKTGFEG